MIQTKATPKISIIILQFNNSEDTIRCLEYVKELKYPNFEVIVIDNASSSEHRNNTKNYLDGQGSMLNAYYLILATNSGYPGGNNAGIKLALEHGADYIFILNPDVSVESDLLEKLVGKAESDEKIGIVGPAILENEGAQNERMVYTGKIEWLRSELQHNTDNRPARTYGPGGLATMDYGKKYIIGSSMLIKKVVFDKIGFLDEKYFLYFEDADFNVRAQKAGFKLSVESDAIVHHKVSSSTSSLGPEKLLYYHYRNTHLFNTKNGPVWAKVLLPFWSIYVILKQLVKLILTPKKRGASIAILKGVMDFYKGRFGKLANSQ